MSFAKSNLPYECSYCGAATRNTPKRYKEGKMRLCTSCQRSRERQTKAENESARSNMSWIKRQLVRKRGKHCQACGDEPDVIIAHHVRRIMDGGNNDESNIMLVCEQCHKDIHRRGTKA